METEQNEIRTARDALPWVLVAVLVAVFCFFAIIALLPAFGPFDWNITLLGRFILSVVLVLLMISGALRVAIAPRAGATTVAIVLALILVPILGSWPNQWRSWLSESSFIILVTGTFCLEIGGLVGGLRKRAEQAAVSGVLLSVTLLVLVGGMAAATFFRWFDSLGLHPVVTTIRTVDSPYAGWSASLEELDAGALGGDVRVAVDRIVMGIIEQKRIVYWTHWGTRPGIEWIDSRTVVVAGTRIDIYHDPTVNFYP